MLVDLREMKPNPFRDFAVDPMDEEVVGQLKTSIGEDGFWGGVVGRLLRDGTIQTAAGHHRIAGAIAAGLTEAEIFVSEDMDDASMVRIYARENATQRGSGGTSQTGSVAAALRFVAKAVLGGVCHEFMTNHDTDKIRGNLTSDRGIGQKVIVHFLDGVPGINDPSVQQSLANLKSSGNYARIIAEVQAEIERENADALAALAVAEDERRAAEEDEREAEAARKEAAAKAKIARHEADKKRAEEDKQRKEALAKLAEKRRVEAEEGLKKFDALRRTRDTAAKATEASGKRAKTFDFEGVSKHLKNAHQIDVFRDSVTSQGIAECLPVENQSAVAKAIAEKAARNKSELTGAFIKENVATLVFDAKVNARAFTEAERARLERDDRDKRMRRYQEEFSGGVRSMVAASTKIIDLWAKWPKGQDVPVSAEFRRAVERIKQVSDNLSERL